MAVDNAIRLAEEVSRGSACASCDPVVQALDATRAISSEGIGSECAAAAAAAAARTAATVWLVVNPGESDRDADRWTRTPEARAFRTRLANDMADLVALDAFTAAVEAAEAVAHDDRFMRRRHPRLRKAHRPGSRPLSGGRTTHRSLSRRPARTALTAGGCTYRQHADRLLYAARNDVSHDQERFPCQDGLRPMVQSFPWGREWIDGRARLQLLALLPSMRRA